MKINTFWNMSYTVADPDSGEITKSSRHKPDHPRGKIHHYRAVRVGQEQPLSLLTLMRMSQLAASSWTRRISDGAGTERCMVFQKPICSGNREAMPLDRLGERKPSGRPGQLLERAFPSMPQRRPPVYPG